jgi:murein DD-endopeptidase MepM/ murein hydrolase activator NlpD
MAEVLPRPRTDREAVETDPEDGRRPAPAARVLAGRRMPQPPGKRAPIWLAALIAGALVAAVPSLFGGPSEVTISASDYGLGMASDVSASGGMDEAGVRQGITEAEARARLGELAASRAAREPKIVLPVSGARLTTCFCMRWGQMHYGIDLAAPLGTPIVAAVDGVVLRAGPASGFGNALYIQDADGNVHIYGHMRYYDVEPGQIVHAGDVIAKVGNEGYSTGPHLHYEIHRGGIDGTPIDPQEFLAQHNVAV